MSNKLIFPAISCNIWVQNISIEEYNKCRRTIERNLYYCEIKDDCIKVVMALGSIMSQVLRENKDAIDNILYG
jgi:hypothetical protein